MAKIALRNARGHDATATQLGEKPLTTSGLIESLNPAGRKLLLEHAVEKHFATGEMLWSTGDTSKGIALVLGGKVRIVRGTGGRQVVIHWGEAGDTLGELPFFTGTSYPATAIAAEPTRCLFLDQRAVTRAMSADLELAFFFLRRLSHRVQALVEKVDHVSVDSVQTRLARFILDRYQHAEAMRKTGDRSRSDRFSLGMTQSDLAEELGTVREVVVRALRGIRELGAIESDGAGKYRVADLAILKELASAES